MEEPIIIVGAGIAGLSIALRLEEENIPFQLIDSGENHSSKIAAGIINPIVFRRMALSWRVESFLPEAILFYQNLEKRLKINIFNKIPIRRLFSHEQDKTLWEQKQNDPFYEEILKTFSPKDQNFKIGNNTFGTGLVKKAFWIKTGILIDSLQNYFLEKNQLTKEKFDYSQIDLKERKYRDKNFSKIIFCEGYQGIYNPYFSYLPLEATKGQLLKISSHEIPENESLNRKCFVLPIGNKEFKIGSTYEWKSPNTEVSEEAKIQLQENLAHLITAGYEITEQIAGIRPTVLDRRPLVGQHPNHSDLFIYNGLGAKGYLISPLLSKEFISHLKGNASLDPEIDIKRYSKNYPKIIQ